MKLLTLLLILFSSAAFASEDEDDVPIRITLPRSAVHLGTKPEAPAASELNHRVELSASTWAPSRLELPSRLGGTSAAETRGLPELSAAWLFSPWKQLRVGELSIRLATGFMLLQRTGSLSGPLGPESARQDLYLLPFSAGLELRPASLTAGGWSGHFSTALQPTLLFSERSVFDDGVTSLGLAGELRLGAESDLRWLTRSTELRLLLELAGTAGQLRGGSLNGLGLSAGVRMPM